MFTVDVISEKELGDVINTVNNERNVGSDSLQVEIIKVPRNINENLWNIMWILMRGKQVSPDM